MDSVIDPVASVPPTPQRQVLRGSAWTIGLRWAIRFTGFISTVVLARLLTPADYGIVTIAAIIVGAVEVFSQSGQYAAIIRHPSPTREHYDTAWTILLMLGFILGGIIMALSPLASLYFHEPRAEPVVMLLGVRTMLNGFTNVGILNFNRDLRFRMVFWYSVCPTGVSFVVTLAAALLLRNYWALVIGIMTKHLTALVLSYALEPFRPRLSLAKARELWSFSIWALVGNVGAYLNDELDKLAIGRFAGAAAMGRYEVGRDLGTMPTREIIEPVLNVVFPVLSTVQDDKMKRRSLYLAVLEWSAIICGSTSIGVSLVAEDLVNVVLGPQWRDVVPLVPWLALSGGILGASSSVYSAFFVLGQPKIAARLQWTRIMGLALVLFPVAFFFRDLQAVAASRFFVSVAVTPMLFMALSRALEVPIADFLAVVWRPMLAGLAMACVVLGLNLMMIDGLARFLMDMASGALAYAIALMLLWVLAGCPDGPEAKLWTMATVQTAWLRRKWRSFFRPA